MTKNTVEPKMFLSCLKLLYLVCSFLYRDLLCNKKHLKKVEQLNVFSKLKNWAEEAVVIQLRKYRFTSNRVLVKVLSIYMIFGNQTKLLFKTL